MASIQLLTPVPPGSLWTTSNWSKLRISLLNPYYSTFSHWLENNTRSVTLHHLAFRVEASSPRAVQVSLRLEHLQRGAYQPYADDQFCAFMGEERDGVPEYGAGSSQEARWQRRSLVCAAPTTLHVLLGFRRATSNLKITAALHDEAAGQGESVAVVVGVKGGSTPTANASRKRKEQASPVDSPSSAAEARPEKLAMLENLDLLTPPSPLPDNFILPPSPLPLPLLIPLDYPSSPLPPAPVAAPSCFSSCSTPALSQCCCAPPPATSTEASSALPCTCPCDSLMDCCASTTATATCPVESSLCQQLCTARAVQSASSSSSSAAATSSSFADDLDLLQWAL